MPLLGIYGLTALGICLALFAPLELAFAGLLAAWMCIPAGLILPHTVHVLLIDRVILGAFVVRLIVRYGRRGEPTASAYRLTPLHAAWAVLLLVGYVDGVVLPSGSLHDNLIDWVTLLDCAVLLVAALAVLRTVGIWRVVRPLTVVVAAAAGIGIIERITGHGWAAYLEEHYPASSLSTFIYGLGTRGGHVRPQAAAQSAIEYGWVLAILLPLVAIAVGVWIDRNRSWGARRQLLLLIPVAAVISVLFSSSRSAEIAVAGGAVLVVITAGAPRRITAAVGGGACAVLLLWGLAPSTILGPFHAAYTHASVESRVVRLQVLLSLVVHSPFVGLGYTGFHTVLNELDDAYAMTYGQLGVIGLLAFIAVLVTSLAIALRTLRASRHTAERQLGAACAVGILAVAVAAAGYDLTFTEQSMWTLVLLGALAVVVAERLPARAPAARSPARVLLPIVGAGAGCLALALATVGVSRQYSVYVISPAQLATQPEPLYGWIASELAPTVCGYLSAQPTAATTSLTCTQPTVFERASWPAELTVSITGKSAAAVSNEEQGVLQPLSRAQVAEVAADGPFVAGKPSWAKTAPLSGGFAGLLAAFVLPPLRRRRSPVPRVSPAFVT